MTEATSTSPTPPASGTGSRLFVSLIAAMLCLGRAHGDAIIGNADWDFGDEGWTSAYGRSTLAREASGGNPAGWLSIEFPTRPDDCEPDQWYDVARTSATNIFAGSWTSDMWIEFDFWAADVIPVAVQVQWQATGSENIWGAAVAPPSSLRTWTRSSVSFSDWEDWQYPGADMDQYLSDLDAIDWIGVYIFANTDEAQLYGLDEFKLMVPEPSEWALLAASLAGLLGFWRRRVLCPVRAATATPSGKAVNHAARHHAG